MEYRCQLLYAIFLYKMEQKLILYKPYLINFYNSGHICLSYNGFVCRNCLLYSFSYIRFHIFRIRWPQIFWRHHWYIGFLFLNSSEKKPIQFSHFLFPQQQTWHRTKTNNSSNYTFYCRKEKWDPPKNQQARILTDDLSV